MDSAISRDLTVAEIAKFTGLPPNQVRARGKDAIEDKFALSPRSGIYRALPHKIEPFLKGLSTRARANGEAHRAKEMLWRAAHFTNALNAERG